MKNQEKENREIQKLYETRIREIGEAMKGSEEFRVNLEEIIEPIRGVKQRGEYGEGLADCFLKYIMWKNDEEKCHYSIILSYRDRLKNSEHM